MKRHLLIVLAAGLLLLSATACKKDPADTETTPDTGVETTGSYIQVDPTTDPDTDADTDPETNPEEDTAPILPRTTPPLPSPPRRSWSSVA